MQKETVKPYNAEENKKNQVERMFDNIAPRYDFLNRFLSLGIDVWWRRRALTRLQEMAPKRILDVATGTGDVAIMAAKMLDPQQIIGVDISNKMLEYGRVKVHNRKLDDVIQLETGDSERLRFETGSFDAITVAFGVRNFENLEGGLAEMLRVLRPGGRAVILEFSRPEIFPIKQCYNAYFKYLLPLIGRLTSNDPRAYTYLYESSQAFLQGDDFLQLLHQIGYKNPKFSRLSFGICTIYTGDK